MASGGVACGKCVLFIWNLLFFITGLLILFIGAMVQIKYSHYSNFVSNNIWTAPTILMIVGTVVAFTCFLGCCGAIKENSCMILTFALLGILVLISEIGLGIAGYMNHASLKPLS